MEKKYPQGVRVFKPSDKSPEFVVADLVIAPDLLVQFINDNPDLLTHWNGEKQIKLQILKAKDATKYNIVVNTYKPAAKKEETDLPF